MIDEAHTLELFGYTSDDWTSQSHKRVVAVCEKCGRYKIVEKRAARPLCTSCPKVGRYFSPATLQLKSDNMRGERNPMYGKTGVDSPVYGIPKSEDHKAKLSHANIGHRHSDATREKMSKNANPRRGKDNNMWKGGVTSVMKALRCSATYSKWRSLIFKRDDWTCQMCNVRGGSLQAHHIRPVRDHKNDLLIFDMDNGITLCNGCHDTTKNREHDFVDRFDAIIGAKK